MEPAAASTRPPPSSSRTASGTLTWRTSPCDCSRAGITDAGRIKAHLELQVRALVRAVADTEDRGDFEALAKWATQTRIAERERHVGD